MLRWASTGRPYEPRAAARSEHENKRKRGEHGSGGAWEQENATSRDAVERAFRRLYATYEWLRDGASPFDAMTACRLQSPNWWRTARDALAAARALLDDAREPVPGTPNGRASEDDTGERVQRVVEAICWAAEAAVALRLPYGALQPAEAWLAGWSGSGSGNVRDAMRAGGSDDDGVGGGCLALLFAAGARCRSDGCSPRQVTAALEHEERVLAVCYTERRGHQ